MSIVMITAVWRISKAKGVARIVQLALADHADPEGDAWPSVATLAAMTNAHETTVRKALRDLERENEIQRRDAGKGGRSNSTTYRVLPNLNLSDVARLSQPETRAIRPETRAIRPETRAMSLADPLEPLGTSSSAAAGCIQEDGAREADAILSAIRALAPKEWDTHGWGRRVIEGWLGQGVTRATIIAVVEKRAKLRTAKEPPYALQYFDAAIQDALQRQHAPTTDAAALVRRASSVDELKAYRVQAGLPITREIERARSVGDLPIFMIMIPMNWQPAANVNGAAPADELPIAVNDSSSTRRE